jgi:predicted DNA-binding transcriptional regulator AlpA
VANGIGDVLLTRREVLARIGMRSTWLKCAVASGEFPRPVYIGNRALFCEREVQAWIEQRLAERDCA